MCMKGRSSVRVRVVRVVRVRAVCMRGCVGVKGRKKTKGRTKGRRGGGRKGEWTRVDPKPVYQACVHHGRQGGPRQMPQLRHA